MPLPKLMLAKDGEQTPKLKLNLSKGERFFVELRWKSADDLDGHALLCSPTPNGGKISAFSQVLSTYQKAERVNNTDKSFATLCGGLTHSGDCTNGVQKDVDEMITIDGAKISDSVSEVPIFVTIHNSAQNGKTFANVEEASIAIKNEAGTVLGAFELSKEFSKFNVVQMGSLLRGDSGWEFAPVGTGLMGDFNTILEHFSA